MKRILIIGAGFAGMYAALSAARLRRDRLIFITEDGLWRSTMHTNRWYLKHVLHLAVERRIL